MFYFLITLQTVGIEPKYFFFEVFLTNAHRGLANFIQFCKAGLAIKSIPATKTLLCSDHYEPISRSHSRHDHQRRK